MLNKERRVNAHQIRNNYFMVQNQSHVNINVCIVIGKMHSNKRKSTIGLFSENKEDIIFFSIKKHKNLYFQIQSIIY